MIRYQLRAKSSTDMTTMVWAHAPDNVPFHLARDPTLTLGVRLEEKP